MLLELHRWHAACRREAHTWGQEETMVVIAALVGVAVIFVGLALFSAAFNLLGRRDETQLASTVAANHGSDVR